MPKTKFQNIVFTIMMVFVMVYVMICYNISLDKGGMSNEIFILAFYEMIIMVPVAFILELLVVESLSKKLAFRFINPREDKPIFTLISISSMIVCLMCPLMSFIATVLFKQPGSEIVAAWLQTSFLNFPVALLWQVFFAGPFVRLIFKTIFKKQLAD